MNSKLSPESEKASSHSLDRLVQRLRDHKQDACDEAADWIEAAVRSFLLYEKALETKCTCETACGCLQCDMVITARNISGIEDYAMHALNDKLRQQCPGGNQRNETMTTELPKPSDEAKAGALLPPATGSAFFEIRQNNSGGSFDAPAVHVIIEASNKDEACKRTSPHFSLCGDSGQYAEYDDCGCCPCCGHRWSGPWDDKPEEPAKLLEEIRKNGLTYMGGVATALIKADGSIIIGDTSERLEAICGYITQNAEVSHSRPTETP